MLSSKQIQELFKSLNESLRNEGQIGEIGVVGGAAMCLVFNARKATKDVDAVFEPTQVIRKLASKLADEKGIPQDWLNDAVKGFVQGKFEKQNLYQFSHLRVWAPEPKYILAMKCISARWDTYDRKDVAFLIDHLEIKSQKEVFQIIEEYYPKSRILPKTQFLIEELFDS